MNRTFHTLSALMRHKWAIEPIWAEQHLPLLDSYLAGKLDINLLRQQATEEAGGDPLSRISYVLGPEQGDTPVSNTNPRDRYALDDPELPPNSVFVLDIRGAIMKETTCCTLGTEDLAKLVRRAYAHPHVIGLVLLIDSPGGQLFGTPTLYDAIRDPQKPTVSVVNEGLMASAAYWLACGSDEILATQQTDQIGSIGVFVSFDDATEKRQQEGVKRITVYADRSPEKNKPFRDAIAGDTKALTEDLNQAADLFRAAVEQGRGSKLKAPKKGGPDVFKGGLFYAPQAIALGLIDGYGNLDTAVARVAELAKTPRATAVEPDPADPKPDDVLEDELTGDDDDAPADPTRDSDASGVPPTPDSQPTNPDPTTMFGDKHKKITALAGVDAAAITDEQLNGINADLDAQNITGIRVISAGYLQEASKNETALATANQQIKTLTSERDEFKKQAEAFGKQPGHLGTSLTKTEETQTAEGDVKVISATDQELLDREAKLNRA